MPILAKSVIEARRAARAAEIASTQAATQASILVELSPSRTPVPPRKTPSSTVEPKLRGHAVKSENDKWQPTGDYEVGFSRPPEATRFKKGGKPGPGRPKGSVSHDTLMKRELTQKQRVRINGREQNVSLRELIVKKAVLAAVEGKDKDARKIVLAESARLFGSDDTASQSGSPTELNASDALSIEEFLADMRREVRAEIEREMAAARQEQQP